MVNAEDVSKPQILGILPSISLNLALRFILLISLLVSGIFFSNSVSSESYWVFKTTPLVLILFTFTTNLSYTVFLTTLFFTTLINLLKPTGTGTNLSISNLSTSVFRLAKFVFSAKLEVSTWAIFLISAFVE